MQLPTSLTDSLFKSKFVRGTVVKFLMTDCDDPAVSEREKYAIVLNIDTGDAEVLLVLTTSRDKASRHSREWVQSSVHTLAKASYKWCTAELTTISLREVRSYRMLDFLTMFNNGQLEFHEPLNDDDLLQIDEKLRRSEILTKAILRRVVKS